jgi:hypothetical protein
MERFDGRGYQCIDYEIISVRKVYNINSESPL